MGGGSSSAAGAAPAEAGPDHIHDFELVAKVGQGAFATVWQARRRSDGTVVAMKIQEKRFLREGANLARTVTERRILERVAHPFIVELVAAFQSPEYVRARRSLYDPPPGGDTAGHGRRRSTWR